MSTDPAAASAPGNPVDGAAPITDTAPAGTIAQPGQKPDDGSIDNTGRHPTGQSPDVQDNNDQGDAANKPAGAPEKYEDFKAPEGATLDSKVMEQFATAARELNLPQDQAQKMIDHMAPIMAERQAEQLAQMRTEWAEQTRTDKEVGGDKLQENMVHAKKALDAFATPELKTLFDESGMGNHPEMVRFMVRAGKAISEDKIVLGGQQPGRPSSIAERMYGNPEKK